VPTAAPTPVKPDAAPHAETLLRFPDNKMLIDLCGAFDRNLARVEQALGVQISRRGNELFIMGEVAAQDQAEAILNALYVRLEAGRSVEPGDVEAAIRFGATAGADTPSDQLEMFRGGKVEIKTRKKSVEPRTAMQADYVRNLFEHELVFGLGPAGTGKTYLAVAVAVSMFIEGMWTVSCCHARRLRRVSGWVFCRAT